MELSTQKMSDVQHFVEQAHKTLSAYLAEPTADQNTVFALGAQLISCGQQITHLAGWKLEPGGDLSALAAELQKFIPRKEAANG